MDSHNLCDTVSCTETHSVRSIEHNNDEKTRIYAVCNPLDALWAIMFEQHEDCRVVRNPPNNWATSIFWCWKHILRVGEKCMKRIASLHTLKSMHSRLPCFSCKPQCNTSHVKTLKISIFVPQMVPLTSCELAP